MFETEPARLETIVAVVGAGPAGIAAAARAGQNGARALLLDEAARPGGQIWRHRSRQGLPADARRWIERLDRSGATVLTGATVVDAIRTEGGFTLTVQHGPAATVVAAQTLILATGARERFLPFPGWTLPGVVGVGGAQALFKSGANFAGRRAVIAGSGPLLLPVAATLAAAGARILVVAEQARGAGVLRFAAGLWRSPARLLQAARYRSRFAAARYATGRWVTRATGKGAVSAVTVTDGRREHEYACDLLCVGYGLVPATELARLLGCTVRNGRVSVDALQRTSVDGVLCAGEPTGIGGVDAATIEGEIAGLVASGARVSARLLRARDGQRAFTDRLAAAFAPRAELAAAVLDDTIVCRCEDVPFGRIRGHASARAARLHTRAGMGPCQGRVCGAALELLLGWQSDAVRPPILPAPIATLLSGPTLHMSEERERA